MNHEATNIDASAKPRLYGRRKGRPLHVRKSRLMEELLPKLDIKLASGEKLDPRGLFESKPDSLWLEIGFGGGEHLAAQAQRKPSTGFIGCEPFVNGIASLLDHLEREAINNVRVFPNDARLLLDALPEASVERCYVLFADPWPKAKHAERRFIGPENLLRLARVLKAGGELRLATDDAKLAEWMLLHARAAKEFEELYNRLTPPDDWVPTRYEQKAIKAGRAPVYRAYRRR
jgi:tRNA (guanine-N7-)-methyltransferase